MKRFFSIVFQLNGILSLIVLAGCTNHSTLSSTGSGTSETAVNAQQNTNQSKATISNLSSSTSDATPGSIIITVNAGPIWNNSDAQTTCPNVCSTVSSGNSPAIWNGQWWTTQEGVMSVCQCNVPASETSASPAISTPANGTFYGILPGTCTLLGSVHSVSGVTSENITFSNQEPFSVDIYWIDYSGNQVFYNTLQPGQSYVQQTYFTHPWLITQSGTSYCLGIFSNQVPNMEVLYVTVGSTLTVLGSNGNSDYF